MLEIYKLYEEKSDRCKGNFIGLFGGKEQC